MLHAAEALPQVAVMLKPCDAGEVMYAVLRTVAGRFTIDQKMRGVVVETLHPFAHGAGSMLLNFPFAMGGSICR